MSDIFIESDDDFVPPIKNQQSSNNKDAKPDISEDFESGSDNENLKDQQKDSTQKTDYNKNQEKTPESKI